MTRRRRQIIAVMAATLFTSTPLAADSVSFSRTIEPLLESRCANCHMTGEEPGEMSLISGAAYESLVKPSGQTDRMAIVTPGNPADSYLLHKLAGTHLDADGQGVRMPLAAPPLTPDQVKAIRDWIAAGAAND